MSKEETTKIEKLKNKVKAAVKSFVKDDLKLLELKVYEPAVSHRIAVYLEKEFNSDEEYKNKALNFDCEYNKCFDLPKKTSDGKG